LQKKFWKKQTIEVISKQKTTLMKSVLGRSRRYNRQHSVENNEPFFNSSSNRTVIQEKADSGFFKANNSLGGIKMGTPGDRFEKEADSVADNVVNNAQGKKAIQQKELEKVQMQEEEEPVQTVEEEEPMQMQEEKEEAVQSQAEEEETVQAAEEEEEPMQMQAEEKEEEPVQTQTEEEPAMAKFESNAIQAKFEYLQAKHAGACPCNPAKSLQEQLKKSKSKGKKIPDAIREEMEQNFGVNFGNVQIHTDNEAIRLTKSVGAQAFTHGNHIYFNAGKFNPASSKGKHLLAHELTHVVQQGK